MHANEKRKRTRMNMETNTPNAKQLEAVSRMLSKILRHEPQLVGVTLDNQG